MVAKGEGVRGGMEWEFGVSRCKLLYREWINKVLLYSTEHYIQYPMIWDFPGGPVVKNLPSKAGDMGSIPGRGTKIPHAVGQLIPWTATTEPVCSGAHAPQLESPCSLEPVGHN